MQDSRVGTAIDHHTALVYVMVLVSGADREMPDVELRSIGDIVVQLPVFAEYDRERLTRDAAACAALLAEPGGFERVFDLIEAGIPDRLKETAYAIACDVAAADQYVSQEESRLLEMLRHRLPVGRLPAAAIERGARARFMRL